MKKLLFVVLCTCSFQLGYGQSQPKIKNSDTLAFDGVPFGVTKDDIISKYHKAWFDEDYKIFIGDYFYYLNPKFTYDGKLLSVDVMLDHEMPVDLPLLITSINNLRKTVRSKYGLSFIVKKMPTMNSIRELIPEVMIPVEVWKIGDKYISVGTEMVINSDDTRSYYSVCSFMSNALMTYEMRHAAEQIKKSESKIKSLSDSLNKASSSMF